MYRMACAVECSRPRRVSRTTLSRVWAPCAMARLARKYTQSGAVSVADSSREGAATLSAMTWCWSARAFGTFQLAEVCQPRPNWCRPMPKSSWWSSQNTRYRAILRRPGVATMSSWALRQRAVLSSALCSIVRCWRFGTPEISFKMGGKVSCLGN